MTKFPLFKKVQLFVYSLFFSAIAFAQNSSPDLDVDVDVSKPGDAMGGDWMSNPLVWVIGALVLIVIIALVARGNNNNRA